MSSPVRPAPAAGRTAVPSGTGADDLLVARYGVRRAQELLGRPPRRAGHAAGRRRVAGVGGLVAGVAAVVGWVAWASAGHDPSSIGHQVVSIGVAGPHAIPVVFSVTRPPGTPLSCVLDATDDQSTVVGRVVVRVPASKAGQQQLRVSVATTGTAVNVTVDGCQAPGGTGLN